MAKFTIITGMTYEVEAPDADTAMARFEAWITEDDRGALGLDALNELVTALEVETVLITDVAN
jgi:hypothetical protein